MDNEATELFAAPASHFLYTDTTVTGGNCYAYFVTAQNPIGGESKPSQSFTVVPITLPSQPDAPTRVTHTQASITLQWAPPASDGDSEITKYVLYAKADFETSYSPIYAGLSLQYQATSLLTGFEYQFKVRAVNALGQSELSAASAAILTALKPDPPTGLTLTARSVEQVSFEWKVPEDKGGIELSGFNIYMAEGSGTYELIASTPSSLNPTVTWHTHEDALIAASWYKFKVSAVNFVGESELTEGIEVIAADVPAAPANPPTATLITQGSISLSVDAIDASGDGGAPITGYIVQIDDGNGGEFTDIHDSLTLSLIINSLNSGLIYRLRYAGRNIVYDTGNMYDCDQLRYSESLYVLTAVLPSRPLDLAFDDTYRYKTALIYKWQPPASDGGSPLQLYTLEVKNVALGTSAYRTVTVQASSFRFEGLIPATDYQVRMKVSSLIGDSEWTDYVQARTGIVSTRPGLFTFDATTRTTIDLSFPALTGSDTGGSDAYPLEIIYYHLYMDNGMGGDFTLLTSLDGATTSYTVQYLVPNMMYRFKNQAENSIGLLSALSTEQEMMAGTLPSAPGTPTLILQSNEEIYFSWNEAFDNGGSQIKEHEVEIERVSDSVTTIFSVVDALEF